MFIENLWDKMDIIRNWGAQKQKHEHYQAHTLRNKSKLQCDKKCNDTVSLLSCVSSEHGWSTIVGWWCNGIVNPNDKFSICG